MPDTHNQKNRKYMFALAVTILLASPYLAFKSEGVLFWIVVGSGGGVAIYLLGRSLSRRGSRRAVMRLQNLATVYASIMILVICLEAGLAVYEHHAGAARAASAPKTRPDYPLLLPNTLSDDAFSKMLARRGVITLPKGWERERLTIPGAKYAYRWHGVIHVHDENTFRRTTPFPPKQPDTFRVMVVGDSLTYGYGIEEAHTYPQILDNLLNAEFRAEVLNLGVSGYQSEDILGVIRKFVPQLKPDMIVYGMCLNDFLPSKIGEYQSSAYAFPIPDALADGLRERSRLARLLAQRYNQSLVALGLRDDFMDDVLRDFDGYQVRFGRDVAEMAAYARANQLPIMAMVLVQYPVAGGRNDQATLIAEDHFRSAGFQVVDTREYFRAYDGADNLYVTRWEGHPNELANALFASLIFPS